MNAQRFLDAFVKRHVQPIQYSQQKKVAKTSYVPVAIATAGLAGITRRELEDAAGGNLERFFENAMEEKCDAVVRQNKLKRRLG